MWMMEQVRDPRRWQNANLAPQRRYNQEWNHSQQHADQRKGDQRIIAVGPVVDQASAPGAERRSQAAADRNAAIDGSDPFATKYLHGRRRQQRAARSDHAAKTHDEPRQHPEVRIPLQSPEHQNSGDRKRVAEQYRRPSADDAVEPADAEHAEQQYDTAEPPRGRCLQRRKSGVDQVGHHLRGNGVHADRGEEERREQRPERVVAHRAEKRPAVIDEIRIGLFHDVRRAGREQPPRQQQQRQQQKQRDGAENLVGATPAQMIDQDLGDRQQHQYAGAGRRIYDGHRGRQSRPEPAAEQDGVRYVADERNADAHAQADAQLELPQLSAIGLRNTVKLSPRPRPSTESAKHSASTLSATRAGFGGFVSGISRGAS